MLVFKTLWGWNGSLGSAAEQAFVQGFDGLECNVAHPCLRGVAAADVQQLLEQRGQALILEITTGGDYTPDLADSPKRHLEQLEGLLGRALAMKPLKINLIIGSDSWPEAAQHCFFEAVLDHIDAMPCAVMLETHRSRSLANPWAMPLWLERHPRMRLTADLSHWCCVAERLMTPELSPVQAMAGRVDHIHARVGHAQGPSVSHPFAPEWTEALEAHRSCWQFFLDQGMWSDQPITITPEFGPDGYMPLQPFAAEPVADVDSINADMVDWLRSTLIIPSDPNRSR